MPTSTNLVRTVSVSLNGAPDSHQVAEARVHHALGQTARAELVYLDPVFDIVDGTKFAIGTVLAVSMSDETGTSCDVFSGRIVGVQIEQRGLERHRLVVEAYDDTFKLSRGTRVEAHPNMSYSDILAKIARRNGLEPNVTGLTAPVYEYTIQRESDWTFVDRIARRCGCEWYVDADKLVVRQRSSSGSTATLTWGQDITKLSSRFRAADHVTGVTVKGWDPKAKQAITSQLTDRANSPNDANTAPLATGNRSKMSTPANVIKQSAAVSTVSGEADALAAGFAARSATNDFVMRAELLGRPALKVGTVVEIKDAGTKLSGKYYLTSVEHIFGGRELITKIVTGPLDNIELVDLVGRAEPAEGLFGQSGLVVGIVTNNKDDEGKQGRVKVKFPALDETVDSAWARVVSVGAGKTRGFEVMPEIDDEVLVGFEQGDLRRPFVIGGLWNGKDSPVTTASTLIDNGKVTAWTIKSREGHQIIIGNGDADPKQQIQLELAGKEAQLHLGKDKIDLIGQGIDVTVKNDQGSIVIAKNGDITIKGSNIILDAQQKVTIKGASGIELTTNAKAAITGSQVELTANGMGKFTSSGVLQLKGSMTQIN